jgi:carbon storage regulator CsrA
MLVLGRRENQSIRIHTTDGIIEILIKKLDDRHVKLGFDAPDSVTILRGEIDASADNYLPSAIPETLQRAQQKPAKRGFKSLLRKLGSFSSLR